MINTLETEMSEVKHTPGPWKAYPVSYDASAYYIFAKNTKDGRSPTVAHIPRSTIQPMEANARLIAAAPELLEALQDLNRELVLSDVDLGYMESHFRPWLNKAYAAIAKATQ